VSGLGIVSAQRKCSAPAQKADPIKFGGYRPKSSGTKNTSSLSSRNSSRESARNSNSREAALNFKQSFQAEVQASNCVNQNLEGIESTYKLDGNSKQVSDTSESGNIRSLTKPPKPTKCRRANSWSPEVEWQFRLQETGWKDIYEYQSVHGEAEIWPSSQLPKCLRTKEGGLYSYWKPTRECPDKFLARVKIYDYAPPDV